jgi:nicotinamide-nucleotide amidase
LAKQIEDIENELPSEIKLAYLPSPGFVRLRLSSYDANDPLVRQIDGIKTRIIARVGEENIFGYNNTTLEEEVARLLTSNGKTVSFAESCTGGGLAAKLVALPGASAFFFGATVTYNNESKQRLLAVRAEDLETHGAVSETVVRQMAEHVKAIYGTDFAVSVSGVAGPNGGTEEKPVGTVWIGISSAAGTRAKKFHFRNDRQLNISLTIQNALNELRKEILSVLSAAL